MAVGAHGWRLRMSMSMVKEYRGIDLMVLDAIRQIVELADGVSATFSNICSWTGCSQPAVRQALSRLRKNGYVESHLILRGRQVTYYIVTDAAPREGAMGYMDVCGKHFLLTGAQMQTLRNDAERFSQDNCMRGFR